MELEEAKRKVAGKNGATEKLICWLSDFKAIKL